jgi:hypothetical protein
MGDPDDYEIAVLATMSECISRLVKASAKIDDEQMKAITVTAASVCLNFMLSTQRKSAKLHGIDGGKMQ